MIIAVCDDEKNARSTIISLIKESGIIEETDFFEFSSSEELLAGTKGNSFDVVFLDVEMGEKDGISAGKEIRRLFPDCIIVYVSGYMKYVFDSFDNEPLNYIMKPNDKIKFFQTLERVKSKYLANNSSIEVVRRDRISIKQITSRRLTAGFL